MMKKSTKIWLITASAFVLIGCIIFVGAMATLKWNFVDLSTAEFETNAYEIDEAFSDISITTDTADVAFALSNDGKCRVECLEEENAKHSVNVDKKTLVVKIDDRKSWFEYIGFHFRSPKITVYLPKTEYGALHIVDSTGNVDIPTDFAFENVDISLSTGSTNFSANAANSVKIKSNTGDIHVENTSVGSLDLSVYTGMITVSGVNGEDISAIVTTGKAMLSDIRCKNIISNGSTGDISLNDVIASSKISIERSTGGVKLSDSDADEIYVKTNTGDVTGSLLSDKVFVTNSDMGDVDVPNSVSGGKCEISTNTGDIRITVGK